VNNGSELRPLSTSLILANQLRFVNTLIGALLDFAQVNQYPQSCTDSLNFMMSSVADFDFICDSILAIR